MIAQPDLFAGITTERPRPNGEARAATMAAAARARLAAMLAELRAADTNPWNRQQSEVHQILFRQMPNWLPPDEREQLRAAFQAELQRLNIPPCPSD